MEEKLSAPSATYNIETLDPSDRDVVDLQKLGLKQETKRRFGLLTILALTTTMMCTWESALAFFTTAFLNGGGPTMLYGYVVAFLGAWATCASMAEMASMYPVSGGQYHWSALLAPPKYSKFLSWLTGWISTLGWQASAATGSYLGATTIQSLISINNVSYPAPRWHGTLLLFAVLAVTLTINTLFVKLLPKVEAAILVLHVVGFLVVLITVVHLAPSFSSNDFVWKDFTVYSGYPGGLAWLIGQSGSAILFIGYDGACHMAEEVRDASRNVPRAMIWTVLINGAVGFGMYVFMLYCFGDPTLVLGFQGLAFVQIFMGNLGSTVGTSVLTALLLTLYVAATFGFVAAASRQAWAFSRHGGLPFSTFFSVIDQTWFIPLRTIALTGTISVLLGLLYLGSSVAFMAMVSLTTAGFLSSYLIPIGLMIVARVEGTVTPGPWTLGRWGLPINIFAVIYTSITVIFSFFPPSIDPAINPQNMNYSCLVFGGVVLLGIIYYFIWGHRAYRGAAAIRVGRN